jgi:ABC-type antimicrobial peptide transport system permease subunit
MTVIGVAPNMKRFALTDTAKPEMIVPYTQNPYPSFLTMQFVIRSRREATSLVPAIREAVAGADRSVPVSHVRTIADLIGETSASARFATTLMAAFGSAALALAMIGVYGLVAFTVQQRRQEFGVRRALGAAPRDVLRLVLREGLQLVAPGIMIGLLIALGAGFALRHFLYEIASYDPFTLAGTVVVLSLTTVAACMGPAWRASRVEARTALEEV